MKNQPEEITITITLHEWEVIKDALRFAAQTKFQERRERLPELQLSN